MTTPFRAEWSFATAFEGHRLQSGFPFGGPPSEQSAAFNGPVSAALTDDYASNTSTTGTVSVGGTKTGNIETTGDTDWFRTTLVAGHTYRVDVEGSPTSQGTLSDPYGSIRNSGGTKVAEADDGGTGFNTRFTYTVPSGSGGTYYVAAGSNNNGTGTYRVKLTDITPAPPPNDDYASSTSTTGTVSVGGTKTGNIETTGDTDWFKTTLVAGHTYQVDVEGSPTSQGTLSDPYGSIRNSGGSKVAEADDGGTGNNTRFTYVVPSGNGGTYFVAAGSNNNGTGTYRVKLTDITSTPPPTDDYASNSSTTGTVSVGGTRTGSIETTGDTDWFQTTLIAGHSYQVDVEGSPSGQGTLADPYGSIRNSGGTKVAEADDGGSGNNTRFTYTVPSGNGGTYFVAAGSNDNGTGTYRVKLTDVTPANQNDTVANDKDTAATLSVGNSADGTINTADLDGSTPDKDWYRLSLTAGHTYHFTGAGTSGSLDLVAMRVYNASGSAISNLADNSNPLDFTPTSSGTYFLAVSAGGSNFAGKIGNFHLTLADQGTPANVSDDFRDDRDDTSASLGNLTSGSSILGFIGLADADDTYGDKDVFQVTLTASQIYDFRLQGATINGSSLPAGVFTIRDNNFNQLEISGSGTDEHEIFTAERTGIYYIRVGSGGSSSDTGGYRLSVNPIQPSQVPDDWADDPNDTGAAGTLNPGNSRLGTIESSGDKDYFTVTLQAGKIYHFSVDAEARPGVGGIGTLALSLRGPNNFNTNYLGYDDGSNRAGFNFEVTQSGIYYIRVGAGNDGADTGGYRVSVGNPQTPPPPSPPSPPGTSPDSTLISWIDDHFQKNRTSLALNLYNDLLAFVKGIANGMDEAKAVKVIRHMEGVFFVLGIAAETKSALDEIANPTKYNKEKTIFVELTTLMAGLGVAAGATFTGLPLGGFAAGVVWSFGVRDVFKFLSSEYYDLVTSGHSISDVKFGAILHEIAGSAAALAQSADPTDLVLFDEHFYLSTYSEVAAAIAQGQFGSAYAHYLSVGIDISYRPNAGQFLTRDELAIRLLNDDPHALGSSSLFTEPLGQLAGDGVSAAEQSVASALSTAAGAAQGAILDAALSALAYRKALDLAVNVSGDTIVRAGAVNSAWALQWSDGSDFYQAFAADVEALVGAGAPDTSYRLLVTASSSGSPEDVLARLQSQEGWSSGGFDTFGIAEFGGHWVVIVADRAAGVNVVSPGVDTLATASIYGSGESEYLYSGMRAGRLFGLGGDDTLVSGVGQDYLDGGAGNDVYVINEAQDRVIELPGGGRDLLFSVVSYALAADSEVEVLATIDPNGTTAVNFTGNAGNQQIFGNAGANTLSSGGGNDALVGLGGNDVLVGGSSASEMYGGTGDDTFYVSDSSDAVYEAFGEGTDRVAASSNFVLFAGSEVELIEAITHSATNPLNLTGSLYNNTIVGNNGVNFLRTGGGNDTLYGLGGDDVLIGGGNASTMYGGTGNDTYYVSDTQDAVIEAVGEGTDRIAASISYTLLAGSAVEVIEAITLSATNSLSFGGNALNNTLIGNNGANMLVGGGGNDTLIGAGGNDVLIGGSSASSMQGGTGDDTYYISDTSDAVIEAAGEGADRIAASVSYVLAANAAVEIIEAINSSATNALNLTGSAFGNSIVGNEGANILNGAGGNDVLAGLGGADTFAFTTALGAENVDRLADFASGTDKIALDDAVFTGLALGALSAAAFRAGTAAGDADDRIVYNSATGQIFFDADGNGSGAAILFATLNAGTSLAASDFTVI